LNFYYSTLREEIIKAGLRPSPSVEHWDEQNGIDMEGSAVLLRPALRATMREMIREGFWGDHAGFRTKREQKLLQAVQLLSLDWTDLIASLPQIPAGQELHILETSIVTDNPLFCIGFECWEELSQSLTGVSREVRQLFLELACVLEGMLDNPPDSPIWKPDAVQLPTRFWDVLKRLARETLAAADWAPGKPEIDIAAFIRFGHWIPRRQLKTRKSDGALGAISLDDAGFFPPLIDGTTMTINAIDVGLREGHPWYVKTGRQEQFLRKCKLIFRGIKNSQRKISSLKSNGTRELHSIVDLPMSATISDAPHEEIFEFTGTMLDVDPDAPQPGQPSGYVEWTIRAQKFELVDEEWREAPP